MRWFYHQLGLCGCRQLKLAFNILSQRRKRKRTGGRRKQKESGEEFVGKILRQLTEWIEGQRLERQAWKRNMHGTGSSVPLGVWPRRLLGYFI